MATKDTYIEAVGRRKTSTARVRLTPAKTEVFTVNDLSLAEYFVLKDVANTAREALKDAGATFEVSVHVNGGGLKGQAGAIRHGIARALVKRDEGARKDLKAQGFLKRDPRMKERKKFGLKSARRAPQWSKR